MSDCYVEQFYDKYCNEEERLVSRVGQVEYLTTMKYIDQYLGIIARQKEDVRILEVGAGTGRYSIALARKGYIVDALELVECNLNVLRSKIQPEDKLYVKQGNALNLAEYSDAIFDVTLVLGPMYHMFTMKDKKKVMSEAIRVTRPKGYIFVAYCMNEATILQYCFQEKHISAYVEREKLTPDFRCKSNPSEVFDLVRVEDIDEIVQGFPVERIKLISTDGATMYLPEMIENMTEKEYEYYLQYHYSVCERQDLIGATNHALDILQKK